jgi:hypothetical protein
MKFSIGDPVYIKANDEEGVIEEFIGKDMACVMVDKKSYHVYLVDLEHPYLRWFLQDNKVKRKKTPYIDQLSREKFPGRKSALPEGIYLVFMPVYKMEGFDEQVEKVKVFLYNETASSYFFEYRNKVQHETLFALDSELPAETEFYLHDIGFEEMAKSPSFGYRFIDIEDAAFDNEGTLVIKPKKFFEQIETIRYANHAFFHFLLYDKLTVRPKQEVVVKKSPGHGKSTLTQPKKHFDFEQALRKTVHEIDLHIEKLSGDYKRMGASEILYIQLTEFRKALDLAIATHQHALIIIHGIGKGVLKNEINSILDQTNGIHKYVNEYDIRYGYGATKVFFRY